MSFKDLDGKLGRWLDFLATFPDFVIKYRRGVQHILPDRASRRPCVGCKHCEKIETKYTWMDDKSTQCDLINEEGQSFNVMAVKTRHSSNKYNDQGLNAILDSLLPVDNWPTTVEEKREAQNSDPILKWVIDQKSLGPERPAREDFSGSGIIKRLLVTNWDLLVLKDGVLYHEWVKPDGHKILQLAIPDNLKQSVLSQMHSDITAGHFAVEKTKERILQRFWWPDMTNSIRNFIDKCDPCIYRNRPHSYPKGKARHCNIGLPNERLDFDICGPLPVSSKGNRWCLTLIDKFTKWTTFIPLVETSAETLAKALINQYFAIFGTYGELYTDQGKNVDGNTIREMAKILQSLKVRTVAFNPRANGSCENRNFSFAQMVAKFTREHPKSWDDLLPLLTLSLNSAVSSTTGYTPAKLHLNRELRLPLDMVNGPSPDQLRLSPVEYVNELRDEMFKVYEFAQQNIESTSAKVQRRWNSRCRPGTYKVGDHIMLKRFSFGKGPKKFKDKWQGPYLVVSVVNDVMYRIQVNDKAKSKYQIVHFDRMKSYTGDNLPCWFSKFKNSGLSENEVVDSNDQSMPPSHEPIIGDVLAADQESTSQTVQASNKESNNTGSPDDSAPASAQKDPDPKALTHTGRPTRNRKEPNRYGNPIK